MSCGDFGWSDWWHHVLHRNSTDRELARIEAEHFKLARASRRHLHSRQLALSYDLKAYTIYNQRVALREREQQQLLTAAQSQLNQRKVETISKRIEHLQQMYIHVNPQLLSDLNARHDLTSLTSPQAQAMPATPPTYTAPSPRHAAVAVPFSPLLPLPLPLPTAPPSHSSSFSPTHKLHPAGESITYVNMSSQSVSSRAILSSPSRPASSTTLGGVDEGDVGESPPPYFYHDHTHMSTAKVHIMLGQES